MILDHAIRLETEDVRHLFAGETVNLTLADGARISIGVCSDTLLEIVLADAVRLDLAQQNRLPQEKHANIESNNSMRNENHVCPKCGLLFDDGKKLGGHLSGHTRKTKGLKTGAANKTKGERFAKSRNLECWPCDRLAFKSKEDLVKHQVEKHGLKILQ